MFRLGSRQPCSTVEGCPYGMSFTREKARKDIEDALFAIDHKNLRHDRPAFLRVVLPRCRETPITMVIVPLKSLGWRPSPPGSHLLFDWRRSLTRRVRQRA